MQSNDVGHFKIEHLKGHSTEEFTDFALELCVFWSKNVSEERDCPKQILLGSMDHQYCMLLSLSLYLEQWFSSGNGANLFFCFQMTIMKNLVLSEPKTNMLCFYAILYYLMKISCCKQVRMHLTILAVIHFKNILQHGLAGMIALQMTLMLVFAG
jgi:hypothetical protein